MMRGMALDEAIAAVDQYLDGATLAGLHEVYIIHGKGIGHPVRRRARTNKHPSSLASAPANTVKAKLADGRDAQITHNSRMIYFACQ